MNIISYKTLMLQLQMSKRTAQRYYKKMKLYYEPKSGVLTMEHFYDYFGIPKADKIRQNAP